MFLPLPAESPIAPLIDSDRLMDLGPGRPVLTMKSELDQLDAESICAPHSVADPTMADCCLAGLWLYYDFLDPSHRISQNIGTDSGSYWHAILHRREPDSWNSKYWFRRVGAHPVFPELCRHAQRAAAEQPDLPETRFLKSQPRWDPFAFVDLCEEARLGRVAADDLCRRIQRAEWQLLFGYCYRRATGTG